jgi:hypothetical protein
MIITEKDVTKWLIVDKDTKEVYQHIKTFNTENNGAEIYAMVSLSGKARYALDLDDMPIVVECLLKNAEAIPFVPKTPLTTEEYLLSKK